MRALSRKDAMVVGGVLFLLGVALQLTHVYRVSEDGGSRSLFDYEEDLPISKAPQAESRPKTETLADSFVAIDMEPQTTILRHTPGFTIFEQLYVFNGTLFVVSDEPQDIPQIRLMTSTGYEVWNPPEEIAKREPTDKDMQVISSGKAVQLFGKRGIRVKDVTVRSYPSARHPQNLTLCHLQFLVNDPPQFVAHYYHYTAELLLGMWRAYTSLDPEIPSTGETSLPPPRRWVFPHTPSSKWTDPPRVNQYVLHGIFPSSSMEFEEDWQDRANTLKTYIFDRVVLADRAAAMRDPDFARYERYANSAFNLKTSDHWWKSMRSNMLEYSSLNSGAVPSIPEKPVITYVSRQAWGRRSLKKEDHEVLVAALKKLEAEKGYEVNIVEMEKMSKDEQILLAGRTTIMMGVHGNGLTSLVWMPQRPKTTVMEFFIPQGFTYDYAWTTGALGMKYFGFWGAEHFEPPNFPSRNFPEGFQGNQIPIDGNVVAALCDQILSGNEQ
ncbi:hypothetical protein FRC03_011926 [Tulasnella sp. 419]|nr:hypothetical protein FRC03_011926 [Tulasnella sp. 419]